jgi:hypothetical protein
MLTQKECEALGGVWDAKTNSCQFPRKLPTIRLHQGPCGGFLEVRFGFKKVTEPRPLALVKPLERGVRVLKTLTAGAQRKLAFAKAGAKKTAAKARVKKATKTGHRSTSRKT